MIQSTIVTLIISLFFYITNGQNINAMVTYKNKVYAFDGLDWLEDGTGFVPHAYELTNGKQTNKYALPITNQGAIQSMSPLSSSFLSLPSLLFSSPITSKKQEINNMVQCHRSCTATHCTNSVEPMGMLPSPPTSFPSSPLSTPPPQSSCPTKCKRSQPSSPLRMDSLSSCAVDVSFLFVFVSLFLYFFFVFYFFYFYYLFSLPICHQLYLTLLRFNSDRPLDHDRHLHRLGHLWIEEDTRITRVQQRDQQALLLPDQLLLRRLLPTHLRLRRLLHWRPLRRPRVRHLRPRLHHLLQLRRALRMRPHPLLPHDLVHEPRNQPAGRDLHHRLLQPHHPLHPLRRALQGTSRLLLHLLTRVPLFSSPQRCNHLQRVRDGLGGQRDRRTSSEGQPFCHPHPRLLLHPLHWQHVWQRSTSHSSHDNCRPHES